MGSVIAARELYGYDDAEPDEVPAERLRDRPTVVDVVVTRDPAQMLPADSRTLVVKAGDRPV